MMGLDFDRSDAHWSYSGFGRFRNDLACAIGIHLQSMQGFGGHGLWSEIDDPLVPLLDHSDDDGELSPEECAQVAPRLVELIGSSWMSNHDTQQGALLVTSMEECAKAGVPLVFC